MTTEYRIPLRKHLVNLYDGDMDELKYMYPAGGSVIIRKLVRLHIQKVKAKIIEKLSDREMEEE